MIYTIKLNDDELLLVEKALATKVKEERKRLKWTNETGKRNYLVAYSNLLNKLGDLNSFYYLDHSKEAKKEIKELKENEPKE